MILAKSYVMRWMPATATAAATGETASGEDGQPAGGTPREAA